MQASRKSVPEPGRGPEERPQPQLVPSAGKPGGSRKWWIGGLAVVVAVVGAYLLLQPGAEQAEAVTAAAVTRTAPVTKGPLQATIRLTGTTEAEKFVNIITPRLRGSRSRRGSSYQGSNVGVNNITVNSTSSVAPSASMSSLSQTGTVASSSGASSKGGGISASSSRMRSSTGRVGGSTSSSSSGSKSNVNQSSRTSASAMGSSGLGTTASNLSGGGSGPPAIGGGGGGGRRGGDFHMALQSLIAPGAMVKKGDIIAEFDRQYMETRLDDYRAAVTQHEADVNKSKAEIAVSRYAHDHSIEAAKGGLEQAELDMRAIPVLSQIQSERTKLARQEAEAEYKQLLFEVPYVRKSEQAEIREAELDLRESKIELERAETNVDKLIMRAPMDGMVVRLNVFRSGEFGQVQEGDQLHSGQPFLQVVDTSSMVIDSTVNQVDVDQLRIGMKARVRFDAFPDLELPARVYSIGTVAKASQFRREYVTTVPVKLKLEQMDPRVIPDLSVSADVIVEAETQEATLSPVAAVFTDAESGEEYVYVKTSSGWDKRPVELGLRNNLVAVVRSGLEPGEVVALEHPVEKPKSN